MSTITFTALGKPQPKGAHTSFVPRRGDGSLVMRRDGAPMVITKDSNERQEQAQGELMRIAQQARLAVGEPVWEGPVAVTVRYFFRRPKHHYGTGRNARVLKDGAPAHPISSADLDKLDRLVFDALTATVIRDDKQIVAGLHSKHFADGDGLARTEVEVTRIVPETVGVVVPDDQLALVA